jgi:hypothetical protein
LGDGAVREAVPPPGCFATSTEHSHRRVLPREPVQRRAELFVASSAVEARDRGETVAKGGPIDELRSTAVAGELADAFVPHRCSETTRCSGGVPGLLALASRVLGC